MLPFFIQFQFLILKRQFCLNLNFPIEIINKQKLTKTYLRHILEKQKDKRGDTNKSQINKSVEFKQVQKQNKMNKVGISQNFVMPNFQTVNKNEDSSELILMDPQNSNLYLLHQYYCEDSEDYRQLITLLQSQSAEGCDSPYVLNPVVYLPIKFTNQQFQSSHFIQVLYQYGSHTLDQQLYLRIHESKNYFQEHQIWSILGSCILGLKFLKDKQFSHSSVCLNDIFVTKQGQIKICHPMFRTYDHDYSKQIQENYVVKVISESYYLAPQQLSPQKDKKLNFKYPQTSDQMYRADVFSLGMTVISLCVLSPISDCYIAKGMHKNIKIMISNKKLEQYFYALEHIYSQSLIELLFRMVAYNPQQRISIEQLSQTIDSMIYEKYNEEQQQESANELKPISSKSKNVQLLQSPNSDDKNFGKFSRVSQASQISSRHSHKPNSKRKAENQPDQEDIPSLISIQCDLDFEVCDKPANEEQSISEQQITNQTLKQYINQQNSLNSMVNQTMLCQQFQKKQKKVKNLYSPQTVVSVVMTSRQLGSLPDDSSIVVQKHVINKGSSQKQNQQNQANMFPHNNFKLYLQNFKQSKQDFSNKKNYVDKTKSISSARTYHQQYEAQNIYKFSNQPNLINRMNSSQNQMKNSLTISLNKDYGALMQNQNRNPHNLYTDPKFLDAIRQDVNKILTKRKMKVTMSKVSSEAPLKQLSRNNIYFNGQKINSLNEPLHPQYKMKYEVIQKLR